MSGLWLPTAERDPHGRTLTYTDAGEPKGCLHTTETKGWPSYRGWTVHPHMTVRPIPHAKVEVRQHVPLDHASFALRNPAGGVETNRDRVVQVELVGTCDPARTDGAYYWPDADAKVLHSLYVQVIAPLHDMFGIPIRYPSDRPYPQSYGASDVRMSGARFDAYSGWLGHEHVPENTHGDPGAFPWSRMVGAGTIVVPPAGPSRTEIIVGNLPVLRRGDNRAAVKRVQALMNVAGAKPELVVDGDFGAKTETEVKDFEKRKGVKADGVVDLGVWALLLGVA